MRLYFLEIVSKNRKCTAWFSLSIAIFFIFCTNSIARNCNDIVKCQENAFADVIGRSRSAVVYLEVLVKEQDKARQGSVTNDSVLKEFFGDSLKSVKSSKTVFGSGFFINGSGYIVTNSHIVRSAQQITAILADKTKHQARIVGEDRQFDIALLKIDGSGYSYLSLDDSDNARVGSWVLAIGSPYKYIQTATAGIVSASSRSSVGLSGYEHFIQTDAAINPGNSGGPLLNIHGEVVGISTAFMTRSGGYMGVSFAIPVDIARKIIRQLMDNGRVVRGWIGLRLLDVGDDFLSQHGVVSAGNLVKVIRVFDNSPAARAGLQVGDLVDSVDGVKINSAADFRNRIALCLPGKNVKVGFYRQGRYRFLYATLGGGRL